MVFTLWIVLAEFRKATISAVVFVCSFVHMEQLGSQWTDVHETSHLNIFRKSFERIQVSLRSDKNNGYFT